MYAIRSYYGEKGKGFAVVAGEIRKLSRISSRSSKEIKNLIRDSVSNIEDGRRRVEDTIRYLEIIFDRITSYNVCYTKLLRRLF